MTRILFGLLLVMAVATLVAMVSVVDGPAAGVAHPSIPEMQVGLEGAERIEGIWLPGLVLYTAILIAIPFLCALGVNQAKRPRQFWVLMGGVCALTLLNMVGVAWGYMHFLQTGKTNFLLGFPLPTALMMFGTWVTALGYSAIYVAQFDHLIFTPENDEEVAALAKSYRERAETA